MAIDGHGCLPHPGSRRSCHYVPSGWETRKKKDGAPSGSAGDAGMEDVQIGVGDAVATPGGQDGVGGADVQPAQGEPRRADLEEGLEQRAGERPVRAARRRPEQPTEQEIADHEASGHEPYRSWCPDCVAGRGRADAHIQREAGGKSLPIFGVDYWFLWKKAAAGGEVEEADEDGEPPHGVHASSPLLCGRCSADNWLLAQLCVQKGDTERNRQELSQELLAGGYPRVVVRSDGEPALKAHIRGAIAIAMQADRPLEVITEVVSKGQSPGNGLAEGAVKEAKGKIRTIRHHTERGIGRIIPKDHDALAWLVEFAAKTVSWLRSGLGPRWQDTC